MTLVYVTTGAWGSGTGTPLSAATVDNNFYDLAQAIDGLTDSLAEGKRIDTISASANSMTFTFTDATTQVIPLPIATLSYRGIWANSTPYTRDNLVFVPGVGVYQVLVDHTTPALPAVFDPDAVSDDTDADPLYSSFLPLFDHFPLGGTTGQIPRKLSDGDYDVSWITLSADIVVFDASTGSALTSTNVADALEELESLIGGATVSASDVSYDPSTASGISSTNVSDALDELGTNKLDSSDIGVSVQAFDAQLSSLVRQNSKSAAYTTVLTDGGKHILHPSADTTARVFTIDSNANVAYPIGTAITFVNQHSAGVLTIAITSDTMRLAGAGTTGSRTLAADGVATALKIGTTEWIISGTGLS